MNSCTWRSIPTVDRISDMPDSMLCHILSFLPTKLSATTSVLSKRWTPVWRSVFTLYFDDKTFKDFDSFRKFVFLTMFSLREKKSSIHSFTLICSDSSRFNQKQFNRIFKFVMQRRVENLNFDMSHKKCSIKLPPCILSFKTLRVLKLRNLAIKDFDHVDFPRLKTLHLDRVYFTSQYFVKFLYGCPILEDLNVTSRIYNSPEQLDPIDNLNAFPNLVKVSICYGMDNLMPLFCKAKILKLRETSTYLKDICQDRWELPLSVPECLSSQLKLCCIKNYTGTHHEFEFAKYIMQHSEVLTIMKIQSTCLEKKQMLLKLYSCTKASTTCKLLCDGRR